MGTEHTHPSSRSGAAYLWPHQVHFVKYLDFVQVHGESRVREPRSRLQVCLRVCGYREKHGDGAPQSKACRVCGHGAALHVCCDIISRR